MLLQVKAEEFSNCAPWTIHRKGEITETLEVIENYIIYI